MVTVITKTIGPNPPLPDPPIYDYGSFTDAEADVENIAVAEFGSTDLVASDGAIVFEAVAGTYNETVNFSSTLTTDATRNVTYRPASGSEHGGDPSAGVIIQATSGVALVIADNYIVFDGLHAEGSASYVFYNTASAGGTVCRNLIITSTASYGIIAIPSAVEYVAPITIENCVISGSSLINLELRATTAAGTTAYRVRNCTLLGPGIRVGTSGVAGSVSDFDGVNNLVLTSGITFTVSGSGTVNTSGSNNFGGSTLPFPAAIQGSPYPITASTAYDPGAGDFALYVGKNGALLDSPNNDVIAGGVGPSVNSDVPTTDILGNERSGALANPGAFEVPQAPTVITRTIGPDGDFTNFTDAEADVAIIGTSADLVFNNERIVFEAEAGTYNEPSQIVVSSSLTTDATRNVTYKAAAGSEHGGILDGGVFIDQLTGSPGFFIEDANTHLIGLGVRAISDACSTKVQGTVARNCIFESTTQQGLFGIENAGIVAENCVSFHQGNRYGFAFYTLSGFTADGKFRNCTAINRAPSGGYGYNLNSQGGTITAEFVNCLTISDRAYRATAVGPVTVTGSNNFGVSNYPFPVALQGTPATITPSTSYDPGAGDYALYVASNGALLDSPNNDVIGQGLSFLDGAGDVPGYDILGNPRGAKISNPGAFEIPQGPTVVTKTIGSDKDYIDFTDAEADVESIATIAFGSTDLVANNGAIVFEADAGTYNEAVTFNSTLTTDETRNVTYKPAAGSEHGGDPDAGVIIQSAATATLTVQDNYIVLDGLHAIGGYVVYNPAGTGGTVCRNLICTSTGNYGIQGAPITSIPVAPFTIENCVISGAAVANLDLRPTTIAGTTVYNVRNCTLIGTKGFRVGVTGVAGSVLEIDALNNLALLDDAWTQFGSGTVTVTGSNNFGGSTNPFPVALQGSPYPITPTTDLDPGPGDWAIYDADTGALIDDPDNDVLGGGVGPDADADVPTTDIVGNIRSGDTTDPGAFQRPALDTTMKQIYQQDAPFAIGASPSGVSGITHQPGPAALDYFTINSTTSETITVPRTAHALRVICVAPLKACDVTLELDASNSVYLGTIGGVSNIQADLEYFWSFASVASDGTYPRVKIEHDGVFTGDQLVYLWWHLA